MRENENSSNYDIIFNGPFKIEIISCMHGIQYNIIKTGNRNNNDIESYMIHTPFIYIYTHRINMDSAKGQSKKKI